MSGNDVKIEISVIDAQATAAWQNQVKQIRGMEGGIERVGRAGRRSGRDMQSAFDAGRLSAKQMTSELLNTAAGIASLTTFYQALRREIDAVAKRNENAFQQQVDIATAENRALQAFRGDMAPAELKQLAMTSRAPLAETYSALTAARKEAGRDFDPRRAADTALAAAEMGEFLPATERDQVASAAVSLQKTDAKLTPQQAVAQMLALSRSKMSESSTGEIAKALGPFVGRGAKMAKGAEAGDLAALALAIESTEDEGTGKAAETAQRMLMQFGKEGVSGSLDEMLSRAGKDKSLRTKIVNGIRNPSGRLAVEELLSGGDAAQEFSRLRGEIGGDPQAILEREQAANRSIAAAQPTAQADRSRQRSLENLRQNQQRGLKGFRQKLLTDLVEFGGSANVAEAEAFVDKAIGGGGTEDEILGRLVENLEGKAADLGGPRKRIGLWGALSGERATAGPGGNRSFFRGGTQEEKDAAASLKATAEYLRELRDLMRAEQGKPVTVNVQTLPANSKPQPPAARGLAD